MSRMQNEKLSDFVRRAHISRVLAGALALATIVLVVSCDSGDGIICPGPCTPPLPDAWTGPFALWQGPTAEFVPLKEDEWIQEDSLRKFFPNDYHPEQDVESTICPPCTCKPFKKCAGPFGWAGYDADCGSWMQDDVDISSHQGKNVCETLQYAPSTSPVMSCFRPDVYQTQLCASVPIGEPVLPAPTPDRIAVTYDLPPLIPNYCPHGGTCRATVPQGYEACISTPGDVPCEGEWAHGNRYVVVDGFEDTRGCHSLCGCGPQEGASCTIRLDVFSDENCMSLVATGTVSGPSDTISVMPPSPVHSVLATDVSYVPGTCQPPTKEFVPTGEIKQGPPVTFCCL